jgi:hypothetical protein
VNPCIAITAALCITLLECVAICKGKNGSLLRLAFMLLGALGGVSLAAILKLH